MATNKLEGPSLGNVNATTVSTGAFTPPGLNVGANISFTTSSITVGNSTVNTVMTSTGVVLSNTAGAGAFAVTLTAGESLSARDAVYVEPALTPGTAGRVYKMDADVLVKSTQAFFVGFVAASASAAAAVNVFVSGVVSGFSGLTAGSVYYASGSAGGITTTKPLHPMPVGMAISATQLLINTGIKRETEQTENVSAVYGYFLTGYNNTYLSSIDRLTFSTGTFAVSASTISEPRFNCAGGSDTSVYGYTKGGYNGSAVSASADRTTFATSTTSAYSTGNLTAARYNHFGVSDGALYAYVAGGYNGSFVLQNSIERTTFTTGVSSAIGSTLSVARTARTIASLSDGATYGYFMGGSTTGGIAGGVSTTDRITFSTSAVAASTVSNSSVARSDVGCVSDGAVYGYTCGGFNTSVVPVTTGDRTTFSTSVTAAHTSANLSQTRGGPSGVSDGQVYGYLSGGDSTATGTYTTLTDRITFSSSVLAAATASALSATRGYFNALSDGAV